LQTKNINEIKVGASADEQFLKGPVDHVTFERLSHEDSFCCEIDPNKTLSIDNDDVKPMKIRKIKDFS
jgi:hypothetical protein